MEHGFYHPDRGYWQTTNEPPEHVKANYPEGTLEVPLRPSGDHTWDGSSWVYVEPPYTPSDLSRPQFEFLLAYTGFGDVWDAMADQAKAKGDMPTFASLMAERKRSRFRYAVVTSVVESMRPFAAAVAPDVDLSEQAITDAWAVAEGYNGIQETV